MEALSKNLGKTGVFAVAFGCLASGLAVLGDPLFDRIPLSHKTPAFLEPVELHHLLSLALGFSLVYLSYQLFQRKQLAWMMAFAASVYLVAASVVFHNPGILLAIEVLSLVMLIVSRGQFTSRTRASSWKNAGLLIVLSFVAALVFGVTGFWFLDKRDFNQEFSLQQSVVRTIREYTLVGNDDLKARTPYAKSFLNSIDFIGLVGLGFALASLFRPLAYTYRVLPHEREAVKKLLEKNGDFAEGFIKLWPPDKSYFFVNEAVVAYRVEAGVALAAGTPAGAPDDLNEAARQFSQFCHRNGWSPAFLLVPEKALGLFGNEWRSLKIGENAIVDAAKFSDNTAANKHFRNIKNRFQANGLTFHFSHPPHSTELIAELEQLDRAWGSQRPVQWGFLQGRFDREYLQTSPLYLVRDKAGRLVAFANGAPSYVEGQATVDLLRRMPDAPPNTMDFLLTQTIKHASQQGYSSFNLGFAPLSRSDDSTELSAIYQYYERFHPASSR